jgi:hypothetical protein
VERAAGAVKALMIRPADGAVVNGDTPRRRPELPDATAGELPSTPLVRPMRYFAGRMEGGLGVAAAVAFATAAAITASNAGIAWLYVRTYAAADVPVADFWAGVVGGYLPSVFLLSVGAWPVAAAVLHLLTWFGDGDGTFADTLVVAGWGFAPLIVVAAVNLASAPGLIETTVDAATGVPTLSDLRWLTDTSRGPAVAVTVTLASVWMWGLLAIGLEYRRGVEAANAVLAATVVAGSTLALLL